MPVTHAKDECPGDEKQAASCQSNRESNDVVQKSSRLKTSRGKQQLDVDLKERSANSSTP
jgi:hypothetical protein